MIKLSEIELKKSIMTKTVYEVLCKNEIKCFLTGGSLLGAYRDGGRLPCEEYQGGNFCCDAIELKQKYQQIKKDLIEKGFTVKTTSKNRTFGILTGTVWGVRSEIIGYKKQGYNYVRKARYKKIIPAEFFEDKYGKITLLNEEYPCPANIEKFLSWLYVDWKKKCNLKVEKGMKNPNHLKVKS